MCLSKSCAVWLCFSGVSSKCILCNASTRHKICKTAISGLLHNLNLDTLRESIPNWGRAVGMQSLSELGNKKGNVLFQSGQVGSLCLCLCVHVKPDKRFYLGSRWSVSVSKFGIQQSLRWVCNGFATIKQCITAVHKILHSPILLTRGWLKTEIN